MSEENQIQKKKSKAWIFIVLAIAVIGIVVVVILMSAKGNDKLSKQLDLAQQYLMEMDYEQAIAAYEEAIAIDPKSTDAYLGLVDVYVVMADEKISNEVNELSDIHKAEIATYYKEAEIVLNNGLEKVSDDEAKKVLQDKLEEIEQRIEDIGRNENVLEGELDSEETISDNSIENLVQEISEMYNQGNGYYNIELITRSQRIANAEPLIEKVELYIEWLESERGNPQYENLFEKYYESLDAFYCSIYTTSENLYNYVEINRMLFFLYMYIDDLDSAMAVKKKLADEYGTDYIHMENYVYNDTYNYLDGSNPQNYHKIFDVYERTIEYVEDSGREEYFEFNELNELVYMKYISSYDNRDFKYEYEDGRVVYEVQTAYLDDGRIIEHHITYTYKEDGVVEMTHYIVGSEDEISVETFKIDEYGRRQETSSE